MKNAPLALTAACLSVSSVPAVASAAGVHVDDSGRIVYAAASGEPNRLHVTGADGAYVFRDNGATLTPGTGCAAIDRERVRCEGAPNLGVSTADGHDNVHFDLRARDVDVDLGHGPDQFDIAPDPQLSLLPAELDPTIYELSLAAGEGNDSVDLRDVWIEGFSYVYLGAGEDTLLNEEVSWVAAYGGDGDDTIDRTAQAYGQAGNDTLRDISEWSDGGAGDDRMSGGVFVFGGAGTDAIDIADGYEQRGDDVSCGSEYDRLTIDLGDPQPDDCELVLPGVL